MIQAPYQVLQIKASDSKRISGAGTRPGANSSMTVTDHSLNFLVWHLMTGLNEPLTSKYTTRKIQLTSALSKLCFCLGWRWLYFFLSKHSEDQQVWFCPVFKDMEFRSCSTAISLSVLIKPFLKIEAVSCKLGTSGNTAVFWKAEFKILFFHWINRFFL